MRFDFDEEKSREVKRKHGVSLGEALEIFDQAYLVDQKSDDPEQFRAIGRDSEGEYHHLITAWKATPQEEENYAKNV